MEVITILIADDHRLVRESWSFILNADKRFKVIAQCDSGEMAVELSGQLRPHVVMMDINLRGINGFEATQLIRKLSPDTKILAVSFHKGPSHAKKMFQKGATGYVTKNSSAEEMIKAIIEIHEGRKYICGEIENIITEQAIAGADNKEGLNSLSQREIEIISFVTKGNSSKEIADVLGISVKTVQVHRHNILKKLNLKNTAALVDFIYTGDL